MAGACCIPTARGTFCIHDTTRSRSSQLPPNASSPTSVQHTVGIYKWQPALKEAFKLLLVYHAVLMKLDCTFDPPVRNFKHLISTEQILKFTFFWNHTKLAVQLFQTVPPFNKVLSLFKIKVTIIKTKTTSYAVLK